MLIWEDTALCEAEWRTSAREGVFLFLSISFSLEERCCQEEKPSCSWSFCLRLTKADVTAGPFNGQRDKSFIWRSTSPPPLSISLSLSLLSWSFWWKPVSSAVFVSLPLSAPIAQTSVNRSTSRLNSGTLPAWRVHRRRDCQGVTSKLAKAYTHRDDSLRTIERNLTKYLPIKCNEISIRLCSANKVEHATQRWMENLCIHKHVHYSGGCDMHN